MSLDRDLDALSAALHGVENTARSLSWAAKRPWTVKSHLGASNGLPMVDLHDLSVKLALEVVAQCVQAQPSCGGVIFITGRGRHTAGKSPLRDAVLSKLNGLEEGEVRVLGPGRVELVLDREKARAARPGMGVMFWLVVALLVLGLLAAARNGGLI